MRSSLIDMVMKTKVLNTTMSGSSRWKSKFPMFGLMELMHRIMGLILMARGFVTPREKTVIVYE